MVKFHGSSRVAMDRIMERAMMSPSKLIQDPWKLAEKAFSILCPTDIQVVAGMTLKCLPVTT